MGGMPQQGGKPAKPPRRTFPAAGETFRIELRREGPIVRFQVVDGESDRPRYLGQVALGTNDIAGVKLFASNRNGAEAVNVLLRDLTIRADRITGLGTTVRTVYGEVVYAEPTAIEDGVLVLGGPPKSPPAASPKPPDGKPAAGSAGLRPEADEPGRLREGGGRRRPGSRGRRRPLRRPSPRLLRWSPRAVAVVRPAAA